MTQDAVPGNGHERLGLLVVGMHRSGTSAATRIISLLGPELPSNLMPANADFNAAGFWESLDVVALNDRMLEALGSSWDDALPIDAEELLPEWKGNFRTEACEILRREFGASAGFVLKDPRIGRLLRPWLDAVRAVGASPLVVVPVRHPQEVAESLQRREGFAQERSYYMWLRHMVEVLRNSRDVPRAIMIYDELLVDWRGAVERLAAELRIQWPRPIGDAEAEADAFLQSSLRHHRQQEAGAPVSDIARMAFDLYGALAQRSPELDALADGIHQRLLPAETQLGPLQRDIVRRLVAERKERARVQRELEQACTHLEEKVRHVDILSTDVDNLMKQREALFHKIAELEADVRSERSVYAKLRAEFDDKVVHLAVLTADRSDLVEQRDRGVAVLVELERTLAAERAAFASLAAEFDSKVRHVAQLMAELDLARDSNLRHVAQLMAELDLARAAFRQLDAALSS